MHIGEKTREGMLVKMKKKELRISVLCYHDIMTKNQMQILSEDEKKFVIDEKKFNLQMKWLKILGYKTLTLDEFNDWKKGKIELPRKSILITFDDGRLNVYKYAMPILKKYQLNACIFTIGSEVNNNKETSDYMTKDIINLCKSEYPNIEFACHSYDLHKKGRVASKNIEELKQDLEEYQKVMGKTEYFAYPYGDYTEEMILALKEKKYKLAFVYAEPKRATRKSEDFLIPRINMSYSQKTYKFILKIILPFIY